MKIGFLILAHRYPNQLKQLIRSLLLVNDSRIYLHVDKKSNELFDEISAEFSFNNRVRFIGNRYRVYWGSFNQIRATFALMKSAFESRTEDYFMLLSGQDFLIKSPSALISFISENKEKQFVMNFKLPDSQWRDGGLNRLSHFSFDIPGRPWFSNKLNSAIERLHIYSGFKRKVYFEQYGGSNWFNINFDALEYMVTYIKDHPEYLNSFKNTRCADEMFVQSMLLNSRFRDSVVSADLRYIDWSSGPEFPRIIREEDFEKIVTYSEKFFARKFDSTIDGSVLNKLITYIGQNS